MRGSRAQESRSVFGSNTTAVLESLREGAEGAQYLLTITLAERNNMAAAQVVSAIERCKICCIVIADMIDRDVVSVEAAADYLFDISPMQVDTRSKDRQDILHAAVAESLGFIL